MVGCVHPPWSLSVGRTTRPISTLASWSRRAAEPGVSEESSGSTTGLVDRSGRKEQGITCIRNNFIYQIFSISTVYLTIMRVINIINLDQGYFVRNNLYNPLVTSSSIVKPSKFSAN